VQSWNRENNTRLISHPVLSFINDYFNSVEIMETLEMHTEVLSDSHRKLAIDILTLIGANLMLNNMEDGKEAFAILVLEKYGESQARDFDATLRSRDVTKKAAFLTMPRSSINRDLLKFFRKRINCKCLKKMHLKARKTQPKLALCEHCNQAKERRLLMVCSRCRISQYCSRECHVAATPEHRLHCNVRVRAEQIVANTTT